MNRIDVSAIQGNPSKFYSSEQQEHILTKHSSNEEQLESNIRPLLPSHSFSLNQGTPKRHAIFHQNRHQTIKSDIVHSQKLKMPFKVPSIDDYYIRQSKENINPNKVHRIESMIGTQPQEDRPSQTPILADQQKDKQVKSHNKFGGTTGVLIGMVGFIWWLCWYLLQ